MKTFTLGAAKLTGGYLFEKQELNRKTTIYAVYDQFEQTGRIGAFDFAYDPEKEDPVRPHIFWDSDVAKWIEGVANILKKHPNHDLEAKVDTIVEKIRLHQWEDGYFNSYFAVCEPDSRFTDRDRHELYCAGHLIEAAITYAEATGKQDFLHCMEKYVDLIYRVFFVEKSAAFRTPGHQELEIALIRLYLFTKKEKYLELAAYFLNERGNGQEQMSYAQVQSHKPIREQTEAVGHSVRAMYQYTAMAMLAAQTGEEALFAACKTLWEDTVLRKMYVTGGLGSTCIGEAFTVPFDLQNDEAYTETCAGIGLMFFSNAMLALENDARYADAVERVFYNGVLSGISLDGRSFFYENPLEINLRDHYSSNYGARRFPATERVLCFECSCCPPNLNRLLSSLENYLYGISGDTLYVNQFAASTLDSQGITCVQSTDYPRSGKVTLTASGICKVAVRIPGWCEHFRISKAYTMEKGYAVVENDGCPITVEFDMTPKAVFADCRVHSDSGRLCIMRGPVVYCAEAVDNAENLHSYLLPAQIQAEEHYDSSLGLHTLTVPCRRRLPFGNVLYSSRPPKTEEATLKLIPYSCFANRGESDMLVWFCGAF